MTAQSGNLLMSSLISGQFPETDQATQNDLKDVYPEQCPVKKDLLSISL